MTWVLASLAVAASVLSALRFLRVAQREHYLAGSATRFALRWWSGTGPVNVTMVVIGIVGLAWSPFWAWASLAPVASAALGPLGLGIRATSAPLRWTARLRRLALIAATIATSVILLGWLFDVVVVAAALCAMAIPLVIDLGLRIAAPIERQMGERWIDEARRKLASVSPRVLAITGSYGKTTTKEYARLLLEGRRQVVASPASFNNAMGLARTINEHLSPGTEVFIAEMGTYASGEIAALCSWIPPDVAVITAIGPVHLERFGSLEDILEAKSEILEGSQKAVLNVDDPRLARLAEIQQSSRRVTTCSAADTTADVCVVDEAGGQGVWLGGEKVALLSPPVAFPTNVACAIGAAMAFGVEPESIGAALSGAHRPAHRQTLSESDLGFTIIDDTYNANPAGAAAGLELLGQLGGEGRRVLVTPGMVEMGSTQPAENTEMAAAAAATATHILIVGRTNRRALLKGTEGGGASVIVVDSRTKAVDWVRANLGRGDVVLYENDLPDHYP